jgi:hypothetical protein
MGSPVSGLDYRAFPNGTAGSDIRLNWLGANLLSRSAHTWLRKSTFAQQTGYYACDWHHEGDYAGAQGSTQNFHFSQYEFGTHPFPANGFHDTAGQSQEPQGGASGGTGGGGTTHYYEIAGDGNGGSSHDYIASAGAAFPPTRGLIVTKDVEVWSARTCEIVGGVLREKHYPDLKNNPSYSIVQDLVLANLNTPAVPTFCFGCSPWRSSNPTGSGSGYDNDETPCGIHRFFVAFSGVALSAGQCISEFASETEGATVRGADVWYVNKNPTPSDITVVQEVSTEATGAATTIALAITCTAGSSLHIIVSHGLTATINMAATPLTNTGTALTFSGALDNVNDATDEQRLVHYKADNVPAQTTTITATFNGGATFRGLKIKEIGGTTGYDATASAHAGQTQATPGTGADGVSSGNTPALTSQPGLISAVTTSTAAASSNAVGSGFGDNQVSAWQFGSGVNMSASESKRVTATTALAGTFTAAANNQRITVAAVFLEDTGLDVLLSQVVM